MLLYVDKKKQKRRQIKKACTIFAVIFILTANIIHYKTALHQTDQTLTKYQSVKSEQNWFNNADIVSIFSNKTTKTPEIIIIPSRLNRENAITIAYALSQISPSAASIAFTPEIAEQDFLLQMAQTFAPSLTKSADTAEILITSDIKQAEQTIIKNKLFPQTLNYSRAQKKKLPPQLQTIINKKFPILPPPVKTLEKQHAAIKKFATDYKNELNAIINNQNRQIPFSAQYNLLKNVALCLIKNKQISCSLEKNNSLMKNMALASTKFSNRQKPQKILFLTTEEEIPCNASLKPEEGLLFRFNNREALLLPQKISELPATANPYAVIKELAGLNPDYQNNSMKFYKFKTTEVNLHDHL